MKKHEIFALAMSFVAISLSVISLYLQFYKQDKMIMKLNPISYSLKDGLVFSLSVINLGNVAGMVNINGFTIMNENSTTKGLFLPLDKNIAVKPGDMELVGFNSKQDPFNKIQGNNKKHELILNVTYTNSEAKSKVGKLRMGFICMSSNKKNIFTENGSLELKDLIPAHGGIMVTFEGKTVKFGDDKSGYTHVR